MTIRSGQKGDNGMGISAPPGLPGKDGLKGEPGLHGTPGRSPEVGYLLVKHSQSTYVPQCPYGQTKLWEGYSLMYFERNGKSQQQDLGEI